MTKFMEDIHGKWWRRDAFESAESDADGNIVAAIAGTETNVGVEVTFTLAEWERSPTNEVADAIEELTRELRFLAFATMTPAQRELYDTLKREAHQELLAVLNEDD